jgi:hypothetical protein
MSALTNSCQRTALQHQYLGSLSTVLANSQWDSDASCLPACLPAYFAFTRLFHHHLVHYRSTLCALYYLSMKREYKLLPVSYVQRVQHRSHMEASKGVEASGRGMGLPLPFFGVDICLLCCLQTATCNCMCVLCVCVCVCLTCCGDQTELGM